MVLISCSGLVAFVLLLLTCLCCKRGDVGFKVSNPGPWGGGGAPHDPPPQTLGSSPPPLQEFENPEGEEDSDEFTPPAEEASSSPSLPDVYVLPLGHGGGPGPPTPPAGKRG